MHTRAVVTERWGILNPLLKCKTNSDDGAWLLYFSLLPIPSKHPCRPDRLGPPVAPHTSKHYPTPALFPVGKGQLDNSSQSTGAQPRKEIKRGLGLPDTLWPIFLLIYCLCVSTGVCVCLCVQGVAATSRSPVRTACERRCEGVGAGDTLAKRVATPSSSSSINVPTKRLVLWRHYLPVIIF